MSQSKCHTFFFGVLRSLGSTVRFLWLKAVHIEASIIGMGLLGGGYFLTITKIGSEMCAYIYSYICSYLDICV